ncbi:rod shape-determining protein MreD [Falsiroseomonas oryzae]|uniref:rod shape-determining protein MreD n=1 Tax=Falsiroseomonas oryzae TaxID=2766473 RepID=UPI0022EB7EE9|nr:rod shape-determining protein MreD [Roseomonas sp. MO-31]
MATVGRPEPSPSLLRRVEALARALMPPLIAALTMVVAAGPTGMPALLPAVTLPQVVFWSIFRPGAMSPPAVFLVGLLLDLLSLAPLGTGVLTLLVAHGLAVSWRRFLARQSFLAVWVVFCGFALATGALGYVLNAALSFTLPPPAPMLHQAALAAGLYPAFAFVLGRLHRMMVRAEEAA